VLANPDRTGKEGVRRLEETVADPPVEGLSGYEC